MTISGTVVQGLQRGRKINFPTANLALIKSGLSDLGVYAVRVLVQGKWYMGMMNIGLKSEVQNKDTAIAPTLDNSFLYEVNIFNFDKDIYGEILTVDVVKKIRDEKKITSLEVLKNQLQEDKKIALEMMKIPNPAYVLQEELLEKNLQIISDVRTRTGIEILVALKSFALWKAFPVFKRFGFDVATASSPNEARLAYEEMGSAIHVFSPCYTDCNIEEFVKYGSHITFNSINQYERFRSMAEFMSVGLRVNPEYSEVTTDLYNPTGAGSRLGIKAGALPAELPSDIDGLHCHTLCESSAEASAKLIEAFETRFGKFLKSLKWVNFGGGHLMTREGYDTDTLVNALLSFKNKYPHLKVYLEPGSAFTWQTGYLLARVEDIIINDGIKTAILNISFSCHLPDCLEMPYMPDVRGAKISDDGQHVYRLGGNSCLAGDFMGSWEFDHALQVGEEIIFEDMIHYTMVKTTTFNGLSHPSIVIAKDGISTYCRDFTFADYKPRLA
ncbi:MAG: carboxynorspermidine decarboxylase [Bacteroidales bacterium]|jgi:carboxynorspermidine decarboxylase|nr:carboxynorspermidine decarboxylase [Bacteroidales bacterium]